MKSVTVNGKTYGLVANFKHNSELRRSFNRLTEDTYGFSFEAWYQDGYWGERYIPYSLLDGDRVISNVSVSTIEFIIEGGNKLGVQIGTVMTDKEYRKQGLNRIIMNQVLDEWKDKADFMYLFANDTVLDFYPKFDFEQADEYEHSRLISVDNLSSEAKKLNIEDEKDLALLVETVNNSIPVAKVSMHDNTSLIMFYCTSFMKNNIYYLDELEAIVIADFVGDTLHINDVFSIVDASIEDIVAALVRRDTKKVVMGFTPIDDTNYESDLLKQEGTTLFVYKGQIDFFRENDCMFPLLSHA
ncbi:MAG: GNAT family N-acetyltransferase [Cyclobacteriaceae bacterium]